MVDNLCGLSTHRKNIPLWYLSADCPLVESVRCNQTSTLVKLSASSLVLVRVYWLDDEGSLLCLSVMVRVYWLDDKRAPLGCHRVWWQRTDTSKLLVLARVFTRWLWVLISYARRPNLTVITSGTVLEQWGLGTVGLPWDQNKRLAKYSQA